MGAIRLFLALVVVAGHWQVTVLLGRGAYIPEEYLLGFNAGYAVMFFYIISGFLITFTLTKNYDMSLRGHARFYGNRFIRIFSLYWPLAIISFAVTGGLTAWLAGGSVNVLAGTFLIFSDWLVTFGAPGGQYFDFFPPYMNQSWTLGAELTFYLIAPLLLRSWKLAAALLVVSIAVRASFVVAFGLHAQWTYTFFPSTVAFFLLGHFAMKAGARWQMLATPYAGVALTIASFVAMRFGPGASFDSPRFWISVILFTAGLPGLFVATKTNRALNYIGALSYPVYLVHIFVFACAGRQIVDLVERTLGPITGGLPVITSTALFMLTAVIAAVAVHHMLEKPCASFMRFAGHTAQKIIGRNRKPRIDAPLSASPSSVMLESVPLTTTTAQER